MTDSLALCYDRMALLENINENFPNGNGVEIGVAGAHFSKVILKEWKTLGRLYLIDLWKHQAEGYVDGCNLPDDVQEKRYQLVLMEMSKPPYTGRVEVIREWSDIACQRFTDQFFDFVYIDANHAYKAAKRDIINWWPKVKIGGVLSGHDYAWGAEESYCVKKAVDEFVVENNLTLYQTSNQMNREDRWEGFSWMIRKNTAT